MSNAWEAREVEWPADAAGAVAAFGAGEEIAWLDSPLEMTAHLLGARYSLICTRPCADVEQMDGAAATWRVQGMERGRDASGWRLWRAAASSLPVLAPLAYGLGPGWIGYVGFETAAQLERLPRSHREDLGLPLLRMALYDRGILLEHPQRRAWAVRAVGVRPALGLAEGRGEDAEWLQRWRLAAANPMAVNPVMGVGVRPEIERAAHERAVARALEYIAAGDIYQVNLAHRLHLGGVHDCFAAYGALRRSNPAPYAALLRWPGGAVASVSPELFLSLRGGEVLTRPIKGTRPRGPDRAENEMFRQELLGSAKEAAELAMIVDLHRNDLGRVCRYGSVRVRHPRRLEAHPTVYHTVAEVTGRLAPGRDGLDLLAACFPAGSVTGVPKIRAMQIIDEIELVARGVYTGAIGVLGLDGNMTFNVAIRTLQIRPPAATLYVGGGIVADSDPAQEYEETLAKARGILRALPSEQPTAVVG